MAAVDLTPEELAELTARPITESFTKFTAEQLGVRHRIAKKIQDHVIEHEPLDDEQKAIYKEYPCQLFYKNIETGSRHRVYGVALTELPPGTPAKPMDKSRWICHTATAMLMFTNKTIGGTPALNLHAVEWNEEDMEYFRRFNPTPGIFIDPLGFMRLI